MKKSILFIFSALIILATSSCAPKLKILRGNYPQEFSTTTNKDFDYVWNNVIDFFARTGIPITTMDKSSGYIVANKINVPLTMERDGKPVDSSAYVVIPEFKRYPTNTNGTATFNVRIRDFGNYVTITVNMYDIVSNYVFSNGFILESAPCKGTSTGVFESKLLKIFNQ
ncbi:MAG: hypothetical protein IKM41_07100 [Tidjanibacter sp.]|nr:hypothetical protein [Tidjanibacter sp.]MBR3854300.1 hypothetical protein [Tidjanibacter sp.]